MYYFICPLKQLGDFFLLCYSQNGLSTCPEFLHTLRLIFGMVAASLVVCRSSPISSSTAAELSLVGLRRVNRIHPAFGY